MKYQKGFTLVEGLLIVLVITVVGFVGYAVWDNNRDDDSSNAPTTQKETTTSSEPKEDLDSEKTTDNNTVPEGWVSYKGEEDSITFVYPSSWDTWGKDYPEWTSLYKDNGFRITKTAVDESFIAPMGGGGGGLRHIYDTVGDRWLNLESYQSTVSEGVVSEYLTQAKLGNLERTVAYGPMGEGGGTTHYFLVTDGEFSYQVVFPSILEEFDKDSTGKSQEQKDSIVNIIESVSFSS